MNNREKQEKAQDKNVHLHNYSLCRESCSVCPYRTGLLKLLDHGVTIVPSLPESDN